MGKKYSIMSDKIKKAIGEYDSLFLVFFFTLSFAIITAYILKPDTSSASQANVHPNNTESGQFFYKTGNKFITAPHIHTQAQINVNSITSKAKVKQEFVNNTDQWMEGIYAFPLPENSAVISLKMYIGDRVVLGKIKKKKQAKKIYNKAKKLGKKASLVEQNRPNIFTMSVANIGPNESIIVELEYQNVIDYEAGVYSLRFPTVVGERYISPKDPKTDPDDSLDVNPAIENLHFKSKNQLDMVVNINSQIPLKDITSPYHSIKIKQAEQDYTISLANEWEFANRDFVLRWQEEKTNQPVSQIHKETYENNGYALLNINPPAKEEIQKVNLPREIIFVMDVSGSMSGASIEQARDALILAVRTLDYHDTFNIITFSDSAKRLFSKPQQADEPAKSEAVKYISSLRATGGTEMMNALKMSLDDRNNSTRVRQVVFLTDGCVGNESDLLNMVKKKLGRSKLFTIGIGSAPNSYFMKNIAYLGRGTHTYIGNPSEVRLYMTRLLEKLESPALTDINLIFPNGEGVEAYPSPVPDLYAYKPAQIVFKANKMPSYIIIEGNYAGHYWRKKLEIPAATTKSGISTLWAREKIATISNDPFSLHTKEEKKEEITKIALKHHLISKYTSLVAVDITPSRPLKNSLNSGKVKKDLPAGWKEKSQLKIPQTATKADLYFLIGMMFIFAALFLQRRKKVNNES